MNENDRHHVVWIVWHGHDIVRIFYVCSSAWDYVFRKLGIAEGLNGMELLEARNKVSHTGWVVTSWEIF